MLGKYEYEGASCWLRMMTDLPMQLRDGVRLVHDLKTEVGMQGRGMATKLLKNICEEADKDQRTLILMPDSVMLQKWYNKHGFKIVQTEPAILMMRVPNELV
jgi:ribosomal protein S18 acetylase RimI-like enzyme